MKNIFINKNTERSRLMHLIVASISLLIAFYFENTFLFILIATTLMLFSNIEKSQNTYLKTYGTILYLIIISWYGYQFGMWMKTQLSLPTLMS